MSKGTILRTLAWGIGVLAFVATMSWCSEWRQDRRARHRHKSKVVREFRSTLDTREAEFYDSVLIACLANGVPPEHFVTHCPTRARNGVLEFRGLKGGVR